MIGSLRRDQVCVLPLIEKEKLCPEQVTGTFRALVLCRNRETETSEWRVGVGTVATIFNGSSYLGFL